MKEITVEVRRKTLSIQAVNIEANPDEARKILQAALDALDSKPKEALKNEIVYEKQNS